MSAYILFFGETDISDVPRVGGKNASLGEMYSKLSSKGVMVPNGFSLTADAYRFFIDRHKLRDKLIQLEASLDTVNFSNLRDIGEKARSLILSCEMPSELKDSLKISFSRLSKECNSDDLHVAVRSSATAEDLPSASFAGRMESFLNIAGGEQLIEAVLKCYASLYTDRALKYRFDMGYTGIDIAISVGVQQMVRSDLASSGVAFTLDPDTGFKNAIIVNGIWGLGENIVQGRVTPDEWIIFKPTLNDGNYDPILSKKLGRKEFTMVYKDGSNQLPPDQSVVNTETPLSKQDKYSLSENEVVLLAKWCQVIEEHYGKQMDIEWGKDGLNGQMYILQARPETVYNKVQTSTTQIFELKGKSAILARGIALGGKIASGTVKILDSPEQGADLKEGDILVTDMTNPDWDPVLKKAAAIITNKGGRTSHAAIVARELGTVAVVGCGNATKALRNGQLITVSCAEGKEGLIYDGLLNWTICTKDFSKLKMPETDPMLILADPERAFELSKFPNKGVGLLRLEFAITNSIKIHPLAFCEPEKINDPDLIEQVTQITKGYESGRHYFVEKLAEAVSVVAAAFYPKDVIVRLSDFKSNEYANLIGGKYFEPHEENPMIGLRGASRYYSDFYCSGFALECEAMKMVRNSKGLHNVKLMIPFCRTVEEGKKVIAELEKNGLVRGENGLQVYVMIEIPSNVLLADEFAVLFDGFSIGSNDLTQLTLGLDRDSALISYLFDEENHAVKKLIHMTIDSAKRNKIKVGLCGQAPSDLPEFAKFLVKEGIDSVSFNPDALYKGIENILEAESELGL